MPSQSSDILGRTWTPRYRLRPTWFGVRLERLVIEDDGARRWVRWMSPVTIEGGVG